MTQTERHTQHFKEVSEHKKMLVASLSKEDREALRHFLSPRSRRDIRMILSQANKLPEECKKVLEGTLFHEGMIKLSLLYSIADIPNALSRLSLDLGLDN